MLDNSSQGGREQGTGSQGAGLKPSPVMLEFHISPRDGIGREASAELNSLSEDSNPLVFFRKSLGGDILNYQRR